MTGSVRLVSAWIVLAVLVTACASGARPSSPTLSGPAAALGAAAVPKRITVAINSTPPTLNSRLNLPTAYGFEVAEDLLNPGFSVLDNQGAVHAVLAETAPTIENGRWRLLPDGRMETTFKIRPGARWHDETAFTSADLVFTAQVAQDRDLPMFRHIAYASIDTVEAPDPQTVLVRWKQAFINADGLFSRTVFPLPMPKHILERPYLEDKGNFTTQPYWTTEFVGVGPYRLREWTPGVRIVLDVNERYVLGRPKIDGFEFRMVTDPNVLVTTVLGGGADMTAGISISPEQAVETQSRWRDGRVELNYFGWVVIFPQFINPNPQVVADARFRRALTHAIDRQAMSDTILGGMVPVADSFVHPSQAEYRATERRIARYPYDPRRAIQIIEGLGYARGGDGMFRDGAGQPLTVEMRSTDTLDIHRKAMFPVVDDWKKIGVETEPWMLPAQLQRDNQFRATFPGFELSRTPNDFRGLVNYHSNNVRLPENNWVGQNRPRYQSAELDGFLDRFFTTVPMPQRLEVLGQIMHHMTDIALPIPLFYDAYGVMVSNRLQNVIAVSGEGSLVWNIMDWDVR